MQQTHTFYLKSLARTVARALEGRAPVSELSFHPRKAKKPQFQNTDFKDRIEAKLCGKKAQFMHRRPATEAPYSPEDLFSPNNVL